MINEAEISEAINAIDAVLAAQQGQARDVAEIGQAGDEMVGLAGQHSPTQGFAQRGLLEKSVLHALLSGDYALAVETIERAGGVAKRSLHMDGQAIDIRVSGVPLADLRDAAWSLQAGGVGYYPREQFVHVDTGPVRHW